MMIRCSASAASTALIDFSRETESGRMMYGKTTTSFRGRTGRMSGIGRSTSRSVAISFSSTSTIGLFFLRLDRDLVLLLAHVRHAREDHLQEAFPKTRFCLARIHGAGQRNRLDEVAEVPLHAEETHSFARPDPSLLLPADRDHASPDRDADVLGLDSRKLEHHPNGLSVVENVEARVPRARRAGASVVGLDEDLEEAI